MRAAKRLPGMTDRTSANQGKVVREIEIINTLGLHARPAMQMVDLASRFACDMEIAKGEQKVDAKSIMQVMTLAATQGTRLTFTADGADAEKAVRALADLIARKFDEE